MKRDRNKNNAFMHAGADAGLELPNVQVNLPNSEDLVSDLFEKEKYSRSQIFENRNSKNYIEINNIVDIKPSTSIEHTRAFEPEPISNSKSPYEILINKIIGIFTAIFGFQSDKQDDNWLRSSFFRK